MLHYITQLNNGELTDLFVCETKRLMDGLDNKLPHNELAAIKLTIKQIVAELEKRKKIEC